MTLHEEVPDDHLRSATEPFLDLSDNVHENAYLNAAKRLGIPFRAIDGANRYWLLGAPPGVLLQWASLGIDSATLRVFLRDKAAAQSLFSEHGIPVPEFRYHRVTSGWKACLEKFTEFSASRFPVVLKPNAGRQAIGVYTDIRSADEIARVLVRLGKRGFKSLMMERHISGNTYRGIVLEGELIDVVQWNLSAIIGDGLSTVHELLNALNATDPEYREIEIHDRLLEILDKHALGLSSVPVAGHRIKIVDAGIYRGARRQRIPLERIPEENKNLLNGISHLLGARLIGVDFICGDVTVPWANQEFKVNEVNSSPGFGLYYPDNAEHDLETVTRILQHVFDDNGRRRVALM